MSKLSKLQKAKRSFRTSKAWKEFRHKLNIKQKGLDPITGKKLYRGANCHHRHVSANEEEYGDLSNEDDFVMLNKSIHQMLHDIYRYWKNDPTILNRIEDELKLWH